VRASTCHALFHNSVLPTISDLHLNSERSDYLHVRSGPNDFLELQTGGSVIHCGQWHSVTFPDFRSRMFCFLWRLVRPSQNGERAGPLAKMLLGAKHGGRPRIVSRIIVEEYFAL